MLLHGRQPRPIVADTALDLRLQPVQRRAAPGCRDALGSSAGFKGNGMCFSTRGLRRRPWRCYGLVEDMEYSWTLRVAGEKIAVRRRASRLWSDGRLGWRGRGQSATALGVRPQRDQAEVPGPAARVQRHRLVGQARVGLRAAYSRPWRIWRSFTSCWSRSMPSRSRSSRHEDPASSPGCLLACQPAHDGRACASMRSRRFWRMRLPWRYARASPCSRCTWRGSWSYRGPDRPKQWVRTAREPGASDSLTVGDSGPESRYESPPRIC